MARYSYPNVERVLPPVGMPPPPPPPGVAAEGVFVRWIIGSLEKMYRAVGQLAAEVQKVSNVVYLLMEGKSNALGDVTLTANAATSTLTDPRIGTESLITFMPTTANAATGLTSLYVGTRAQGSCTLTHANNAQTDRTYVYEVRG